MKAQDTNNSPDTRQSEDELHQVETQFWTAFRGAPIGMAILTPGGQVINANSALQSILKREKDKITRRPFNEFIGEEDIPGFDDLRSRLLAGETETLHEEMRLKSDGGAIGRLTLTLVRGVMGQPRYLLAMVEDITERKRAEETLKRNEWFLEKAQEVAHVGSWISDPAQSGNLYWSKEVYRIFGLDEKDFDGRAETFFSFIHPDDVEGVRQVSKDATEGTRQYDVDHRIVRPDGTVRWVREIADILRDEQGNPLQMVGVVQDITDRKEAEEALRESAERFQGAVEGLLDPFGIGRPICDETGRIVDFLVEYANKPALEFLGVTSEEFIGGRMLEVLPAVRTIGLFHMYVSVAETGRPLVLDAIPFEMTVRGDRPGRIVDLSAVRVEQSVVVSWRDVTERVRAEQALEESRHDLERAQAIAHIGSWRLDVRRNELLWSNETHRIFGIPLGTPLTYEGFLDCIHPDDREFVDSKWQAALTGGSYDIEHRICVGQAVKWIRETAELEFDEHGQLVGGFGTARDITDSKLAEEELSRSREELVHNFSLLQRALLPARPPEFPGYIIASAYLPMPQAEIGGDFYDFFMTENGKIAILIGDVAGKGIPSASLAAATRSTVRAFAYDISSPDQALAHANSVLKGAKDDPALFVTVLLVTLDSDGRTCYASAGHPPPAVYRAKTGEVHLLEDSGLLLGVADSYDYEESECYLDPGDKLVLYTDGLSEARRSSMMFGSEGIERVLEAHGRCSPDEIVEALIRESKEWGGGRRSDDAAIIVVERR